MEGEGRSFSPYTPTVSVIPNNAHQTNLSSSEEGLQLVNKHDSQANTPSSAGNVSIRPSSSYAIADIQMVDVQYGSVDSSHGNKVNVGPPWPLTSSTIATKVTTQVPAFSGYALNKTHTVVVDVSKENDLNMPALVATTNYLSIPVEDPSVNRALALNCINDNNSSGVQNLKKLFRTLQEFANKRSQATGERVGQIINNLVAGRITVEKFNEDMMATTDYPIKDCLIPLIKDNLPSLQREYSQAHKMAAASPVSSIPSTPIASLLGQSRNQPKPAALPAPPPYTQTDPIMQQNSNAFLRRKRPRNLQDLNSLGEIVSSDVTVVSWQDAIKKPRPSTSTSAVETPVTSAAPSASPSTSGQDGKQQVVYAEEWRHIDQMMWCVIGMVEKTRQAINTMRNKHYSEIEALRRGDCDFSSVMTTATTTTPSNNSRLVDPPSDTSKAVEIAIAAVKHQAEIDRQRIMAQADQRCKDEIQRAKKEMEGRMLKAQQAQHDLPVQMSESSDVSILLGGVSSSVGGGAPVIDIQRQQHIVEEAERRCHGQLDQMRREIDTLKDSLREQVDSDDTCWNCGRVARDKCSGCGKACYCGRFCQHKHWSRHQLKCLQLRGKGGSSNVYPALGHHNSSRTALQTVAPSIYTSTSHSTTNNDVIIIPSLQPVHKSLHQNTGHILVTSHPPVRLHQDVNHSSNMILNNSPQQQVNQIQSPIAATMISLDSSKSKMRQLSQDIVTISSPTQPPRLSNSDMPTSNS